MYKGDKTGKGFDFMNFIEGNDVYNSQLLFELEGIQTSKEYEVKSTPNRMDLISERLYKSYDNMPFLLILNRVTPEQVAIGSILEYLEQKEIDNIVTKAM